MTISHRVSSQTLAGLLGGFVNEDVLFATIVGEFRMTRLDLRLTDAPSGGSVAVMVNTVTGGGGSQLLQGTILDGTTFLTVTGDITLGGTTEFYLRITAESGDAMGLSASVELSLPTGGVVTVMLSTVSNVKDSLGVTDALNDTVMLRHLEGVSRGMQEWMGQKIVLTVHTFERHFPTGLNSAIVLKDGPLASIEEIRSNGAILDTANYRLEDGRILRRVSGGVRMNWIQNTEIEVDYTSGFLVVPNDLVDACTQETVRRWLQTVKAGGGGAHVESSSPETGDVEALITDGFMPQTIETMRHYRRFA